MPRNQPPAEYQFKPGQSGNPAGYSRGRRITDRLLDLIAEKHADKALAGVWLTAALKGDYRFFRELLDRCEGPILLPTPEPDEESKPRIAIPRSPRRAGRSASKRRAGNGDPPA